MADYGRDDEAVYAATVGRGDVEVDASGRMWRIAKRDKRERSHQCARVEVGVFNGGYLRACTTVGGRCISAQIHRLVWRHFFGPIPNGLTVNHKNGVRNDNHPDNLELMTQRQQMAHARDILGKKNKKGESSPLAKVTDMEVLQIRLLAAAGCRQKDLAVGFGLSRSHVSHIVNWRTRNATYSS